MARTIAIFGFAETTRHLAHESNADEFWTLNHAYKYDPPDISRLYELHHDYMLFGENLHNGHYEFLTAKHSFPIYMQTQRELFPSSVRFPLNDIMKDIDGMRGYLTNSIAMMIAHAIYEKVDRIEVYGVDMAKGTEYAYQKAGTEYTLGIAIGRGIDVYLPTSCPLLKSGIYGYDGHFHVVHKEIIEEHREHYNAQLDNVVDEYNPLAERYNAGEMELKSDVLSLKELIDLWTGAAGCLIELYENALLNNIISRQSLEKEKNNIVTRMDAARSNYNFCSGRRYTLQELGISGEAAHQEALKSIKYKTDMILNDGAMQAVNNLIAYIDSRSVDMNITPSTKFSE